MKVAEPAGSSTVVSEKCMAEGVIACTRCLYDSRVPGISFDARGMCNYCALHDQMNVEYPLGEVGAERLRLLVEQIRQAGKGRKYDCVVGVSGGCDSSYLLYKMIEAGLRPLAAHFDNTWNSPISTQNIHNVLDKLGVDLYTHVVNNKEYDDLYRAFMLAGVKDIEAPTDIGLAATLYRAAEHYGIKYIIEGHSFRTEGISPLGWLYMDGKYIESIHQQYGTRQLKTFPNMKLFDFIRWTSIANIRKVRPLYFMNYQKEDAKKFLAEHLEWQWYGGHHLENRFTAFYHSYYLPRRYGIDTRVIGYAALVRSEQLTREEGLAKLADTPHCESDLIGLVKKRLGFTDAELQKLMLAPQKSYTDFKTYKKTFERLRWLFWVLYKLDRVPKSFYLKFANRQLATR